MGSVQQALVAFLADKQTQLFSLCKQFTETNFSKV
jgi:hypothetical protein